MRIDLNADLGESAERWGEGTDRELLQVVTSANVCTGAYAGDDALISETCAQAVRFGVRIGAQVGYPDRANFGRAPMEFDRFELAEEIAGQIDHLSAIAAAVGGSVAYVKPHGALYHRIVSDPDQAAGLRCAIGDLPLLGLAGSLPGGAPPDLAEGFADRGYAPGGGLIPRTAPGALITDPEEAAAQAVRLMQSGVDSICVHSDSPGALAIARAVRLALESTR